MSTVLSTKNEVIVASAGSRKTSYLVECALAATDKKVLITTYTNESLTQIRDYIIDKKGMVPGHITIMTWYSFLLHDGVRPYQGALIGSPRIRSILFKDQANQRKVARAQAKQYYITSAGDLFRDKVSEFACFVNAASGGAVVRRMERVYDLIVVDELQDMGGHDLVLLELLFRSRLATLCVGDPRQAIYTTNRGQKYSQYRRGKIIDWIVAQSKAGVINVVERQQCYRCNQLICDFADGLYPHLPKTQSVGVPSTEHDGIAIIPRTAVGDYVERYRPIVLRDKRTVDTMDFPAMNFGQAKGRSYDRILIFPTGPMKKYLSGGPLEEAGDLTRFYVAVTRARYSVAFVVG